jgi:hypothetical protein
MLSRLLRLFRTFAAVALAVAVSSFAGAKPPDLPTATREVVTLQAAPDQVEIMEEHREDKVVEPEQIKVMPVEVERIPVMPMEVAPEKQVSGDAVEEFKKTLVQVQDTCTGHLGEELRVAKPPRIGEVIIVGNAQTKDRIIRSAAGLYPGDVLNYPQLQQAERNLEKLGIFVVDRERGLRPTVSVLEDEDAEFKNVLIQVKEPPGGAVTYADNSLGTTHDVPNLAAARRMYLIAERCRRQGDLDMASNCYQETLLLCPHSAYGRKSLTRLHEIEACRVTDTDPSEAEEQDTPPITPKPDAAPPDQESFLQPRVPLIVEEESQTTPGAGEEQLMPSPPQPPVLFVAPPPKNLTIHVDEPETYGAVNSVLRQAGDALEAVTGFDIDIEVAPARSGSGLRAQGSVQLGKLGYKVIYDDDDGRRTWVLVPARQ